MSKDNLTSPDFCRIGVQVIADLDFPGPPKNREDEIMREKALEAVRLLAHKVQPIVADIMKVMINMQD